MKNLDLERRFINHVLKNVDNALKAQQLIPSSWIQDVPVRKLYEVATFHAEVQRTLMLLGDLEMWLSKAQSIDEDTKKKVISLFNELVLCEIDSDFALVLEQMAGYKKHNLLITSMEKASGMLNQHQIDSALIALKEDVKGIEKSFAITRSTTSSLEEDAQHYWADYMDRKLNPGKYVGLFTGFDEFDRITNGLKPGNLVFIIGGWKSAKSVLALNIAYNVAQPDPSRNWPGKRVLMHINEGGTVLPKDRLISCALGINQSAFQASKSGNPIVPLTPQDEARVQDLWFGPTFKDLRNNIILDEAISAQSTPDHIERKIEQLQEEGPLGLVIIDIFGNLTDSTPMRKEESYIGAGFGKIAKDLKDMAEKYQVPIIIMHHVTKDAMKGLEKTKDMEENYSSTDFGLSSQPQKHADMIIAWRICDQDMFDRTHTSDALLSIVSTRSTEKGSATLKIDTKIMKVTNFRLGGV